jgi:hypothetical protein
MAVVITNDSDRTLRQQLDALLAKRSKPKSRDWKAFFGKVKLTDDPVAFQRELRDE